MVEVSSPGLSGQPAYVPGLGREAVSKRFDIPVDDIAKLGSAENPFGPSPKASAAIEKGKARLDLYPEWSAQTLREAIGRKYGFDSDCVVCGSGETEIISFILRAFAREGETVLMYEPCFPIYHIFAENEGRKPIYVPMRDGFDLVVGEFITKLKTDRPKIAFITNPHSPSGQFMQDTDIKQICEAAPETLIVLDEAYIHFSETAGGVHLTHAYDNLIVLRTFSKAFGLAGLRLGFGIAANKGLINPILNMKPTWNLGHMQVEGGIAAIDDDEHVHRTVKMVVEMRAYITDQLSGLNRFRMVSGSRSNFFLLEVVDRNLNSTIVFQELLSRGVIVKNGSDSFRGLGDRFLRIDVSVRKNMDRLIWALKDIEARRE